MGLVKKDLSKISLPDRESHNSRMFIDLCENIHIHYREFRVVFSLDEYFEFVDILNKSTDDVRNYLSQNPDYEEGKYGTTIMIAGGKDRQRKLLENSPEPNRSAYFANHFGIELQDESVTDEIHVHWRDYRFALNREHFKLIAASFTEAKDELEKFEEENNYQRSPHMDRDIEDFKKEREKYSNSEASIMGEKKVLIDRIKTRWEDIERDFEPPQDVIELLVQKIRNGEKIFPILLSTEENGDHYVIDGNHRLLAAIKAGKREVSCIVCDITFEQSSKFRRAEALLKKFDKETGYKYGVSSFNRDFVAYKLNRYYKDHFHGLLRPKSNLKGMALFTDKISKALSGSPRLHKAAQKAYHFISGSKKRKK